MLCNQQLFDAFQAALDEERRLLQKVKGVRPDAPNYHDVWNHWLEAVNRSNAAAKALRESSPELLE